MAATSQLDQIQVKLDQCFQRENWSEMTQLLNEVSEMGEQVSQQELSLWAQRLSQQIQFRLSQNNQPHSLGQTGQVPHFQDVVVSYQQVMDHLSHLRWKQEFALTN